MCVCVCIYIYVYIYIYTHLYILHGGLTRYKAFNLYYILLFTDLIYIIVNIWLFIISEAL
jgi:hypothetical protein